MSVWNKGCKIKGTSGSVIGTVCLDAANILRLLNRGGTNGSVSLVLLVNIFTLLCMSAFFCAPTKTFLGHLSTKGPTIGGSRAGKSGHAPPSSLTLVSLAWHLNATPVITYIIAIMMDIVVESFDLGPPPIEK